jgi:HD-GYP domain-containing protein (c-di-GMP phosphodiesterase class II)
LQTIGAELFKRYGEASEPTVIDDLNEIRIDHIAQCGDNMLVVPLRTAGRSLGVLYGGDKLDGSGLTSVDSKLCNSLANTLAIFVENRMLYEDMHAMFLGTLHALTSAIDAKDSYTHGHTERVAKLSRMLAEAWGLDKETVERVYISGLVHDVGKIGVPESVLCKPGKLTDDEFALIKMHPEIGARILQDIRQMEDLLPGVMHHHERWDGNGYPHKLGGYDIPLFGRLIGLADAFDAMISTRTYRSAMSLEAVLEEIRRCAGTQFDPELAEVFLQLDFGPFFELLEKHQHEKSGQQPA